MGEDEAEMGRRWRKEWEEERAGGGKNGRRKKIGGLESEREGYG